jgi:hypothetical protein
VEIPQREETMNTDFILYICMIAIFAGGFVLGRWERKDAYLKAYNRGKEVQAAIAAQTARNILESLGER